MLNQFKERFRSLLAKEPSLSPIKEQMAIFDQPAFLQKTKRLKDSFIREHALNVIERGFTVIPNSLDEDLIDAAVDSFLAWKERNQSRFLPEFYKFDDKLDRVVNLNATLPEFRSLFSRNRALLIQDYLYQAETVLYTTLFFEVGSAQKIHRDIPLFWTKPATMYFGTWVALEKTDNENGPLTVIPGSHRLPLLDRDAIAREKYNDLSQIQDIDNDLWRAYQAQLISMCEAQGLKKVDVHVDKGETIIWHPLLAHGGAAITDPGRSRMSFVMHTTPKDVPVFHTDVFFNVNRPVPDKAPWKYDEIEGRAIAHMMHTSVSQGQQDYDFTQLT